MIALRQIITVDAPAAVLIGLISDINQENPLSRVACITAKGMFSQARFPLCRVRNYHLQMINAL